MNNMDLPETDELQRKFQRDINCLVDDDRNLRRTGLTNIKNGIFSSENKPEAVRGVFERGLLKNLLRVLDDKVEKHRELSLSIIQIFIKQIPITDEAVGSSILKTLFSRLNVLPFPEQGEEIRFQIVKLIRQMLTTTSDAYLKSFNWNAADLANTISKALTDNYAEVKKEASLLLIDASRSLHNTLGDHSAGIVKSLIKNLGHQHSKVRKMTLEATGELLLVRSSGNQLREMLPILKIVTNDKTVECRRTSYLVITQLLNKLPESVLRDYESELVQYLLNGLSDDSQEVIDKCKELISQVGTNLKNLNGDGMDVETAKNTNAQ